ncbi:DUF6538 domain-containing protein [Sphingomonas sp.]|uniref:DUF6538 domain-containing protein n=1 Tax=Sphingomonas sp. TaxID=28214 RepID=UPI003FA764B7
MCTYLQPRGAVYHLRRVIPVELRPASGGKSEFMASLRTVGPGRPPGGSSGSVGSLKADWHE